MNYGICSLMARIALVHSLGLSLMVFLDMPTGMPLGDHYSLLFYGYIAIVWVSMVHTHSVFECFLLHEAQNVFRLIPSFAIL